MEREAGMMREEKDEVGAIQIQVCVTPPPTSLHPWAHQLTQRAPPPFPYHRGSAANGHTTPAPWGHRSRPS